MSEQHIHKILFWKATAALFYKEAAEPSLYVLLLDATTRFIYKHASAAQILNYCQFALLEQKLSLIQTKLNYLTKKHNILS